MKVPEQEKRGEPVELVVTERAGPNQVSAYEALIDDVIDRDPTRFARQDYVDEAWRIVDPILGDRTPVHAYGPGTWGPAAADTLIGADGPVVQPGVDRHAVVKPTVRVFATPDELFDAAAALFVETARARVAADGRFSVALSGGTTPARWYARLSAPKGPGARVPWNETRFFWADERLVPPDHPASNFGAADAALLRHWPVDPGARASSAR